MCVCVCVRERERERDRERERERLYIPVLGGTSQILIEVRLMVIIPSSVPDS